MNRISERSKPQQVTAGPAALCALPLAALALASTSLPAATLKVANCNDAGAGSLRAVVGGARSGDVIDLGALTCATITLDTGGLYPIPQDLTLRGPTDHQLTIKARVSGYRGAVLGHGFASGTLRVESLSLSAPYSHWFSDYYPSSCIWSYGKVELDHVTLTHCGGGGVYATNGLSARDSTISYSYLGITAKNGPVSIVNSTISGNESAQPCVAMNLGRRLSPIGITITNSTISGNKSHWHGGLGYNPADRGNYDGVGAYAAGCVYGDTTIVNSTIAMNSAEFFGGGLKIGNRPLLIENSILAGNSLRDLSAGRDMPFGGQHNIVQATYATLPSDTIRSDPQLLPLADNGGPTRTHRLATGSPAIDAAAASPGVATDQRGPGFVRAAGAGPDIGAYEEQGTIGPHMTGNWFDPAQGGHGLMIEVLPNRRLLAMWFAFDPSGNQAWFGGTGTFNGNTAIIDHAAISSGGRWLPNFDPNQIVTKDWGSMTLTFADSNHGSVEFHSTLGFGSGAINLARVTDTAVQRADAAPNFTPKSEPIGAAMSGSWFDPNQSGHGLMIEALPKDGFLALWFAFEPSGGLQAWFGGSGRRAGNGATIAEAYQPTGGRWVPDFDPATVEFEPWGSMSFSFFDCNHGRVDFRSSSGFGNGFMDLTRLTLPAGLTCP